MESLLNIPQWWKFCEKYRYDIFSFAVEVVGLNPTWQQAQLFEAIAFDGSRTSVASGHGCFAKGTPIRLANGHVKPIEKVTVDDQVMGHDGKPRDIVSLARGREEMFEFTLSNGLQYTFNKSHILCLRALKSCIGWKKGDLVEVTIHKWLKWTPEQRNVFGFYRVKNKNVKKTEALQITSWRSVGEGNYYGFCLFDDPLFLSGDGVVLHNTGKTASAGVVALWHLLVFPKSLMMFTAPSLKQIKGQVWKEISLCLARMQKGVYSWLAKFIVPLSETVYIRGFKDTWRVYAKTAPKHAPQNIAGEHGTYYTVWCDEASGISQGVFDVILGALTGDYNRAILTAQPATNTGHFYDTHHRLSYRNGGDWISLRFNGEESPIVSLKSLKEQLLKYANRKDPQYQIRVLGLFPELLGEYLIGRTQADLCYQGKTAIRKKHDDYGFVIAVDVGGGVGRDDSVITVARMWGNDFYGDFERRVDILDIPLCQNDDDITLLYEKITELFEIYPNVTLILDDNGTGRGLGQKLKRNGYEYVPAKWSGRCNREERQIFVNLRAKAYVALKNAIGRGLFKIKTSLHMGKILEQMTAIPYQMDEQSRYQIMSKDLMRRRGITSPDILDTFAFLFLPSLFYTEASSGRLNENSRQDMKMAELRASYDEVFKEDS